MAMFGQGLSVRLSANTRDFDSGVSGAQRSLTEFGAGATAASGPLQLLQSRADEAGDEIADVDREAGQATRGLLTMSGAAATSGASFSVLSAGTQGLSFSVGTLSSVMTTALIPALALLSTTLLPLTAVLGTVAAAAAGLAGAFGLIVGSGALAWHRQLKKEGSSLLTVLKKEWQQVKDLVAEFGGAFVPLIKDAVQNIDVLVRRTLEAIGGMDTFTNALRELGGIALRVIPEMVAGFIDLGRRALPAFMNAIRWLIANGPAIFREMIDTTRRLVPHIMDLIDGFIEAAPAINRFGTLVLTELLPALSTGLVIFGKVLNIIGNLREAWESMPGWLQTGIFVAIAGAVGILSGGLLGLVAAFTAVFVAWQKTKKFLKKHGVLDDLKNAFRRAADIIKSVLGGLLTTVKNTAGAIEGIWRSLKRTLVGGSIIPSMTDMILSDFRNMHDTLEEDAQSTVKRLDELWQQYSTEQKGRFEDDNPAEDDNEFKQTDPRQALKQTFGLGMFNDFFRRRFGVTGFTDFFKTDEIRQLQGMRGGEAADFLRGELIEAADPGAETRRVKELLTGRFEERFDRRLQEFADRLVSESPDEMRVVLELNGRKLAEGVTDAQDEWVGSTTTR